MSSRIKTAVALLAICVIYSGSDAKAGFISNLGEPPAGSTQVFNTQWVAMPFTLDGFHYDLNSATLGLTTATSSGGNFVVQIRNDAAGSPGSTVLATLSGNSNPSGGGNQIYTGNVRLNANQTYYVVAGVTAGAANYGWLGGFSDNQTGTLAWNIGDVDFASPGNPGNVWSFTSTISNLVSLDATPVPEPDTLTLVAIGLACFGGFRRFRRRGTS